MQTPATSKAPTEAAVKDVRRRMRKWHSAEEKSRVVLRQILWPISLSEAERTVSLPNLCNEPRSFLEQVVKAIGLQP